jgi:hypothetical protein
MAQNGANFLQGSIRARDVSAVTACAGHDKHPIPVAPESDCRDTVDSRYEVPSQEQNKISRSEMTATLETQKLVGSATKSMRGWRGNHRPRPQTDASARIWLQENIMI